MKPVPTTWVMLEPGMYVQGTDGSVWRVDEKRYTGGGIWWFALTNRRGELAHITKQPEDPATLMQPTHEDAEALLVAAGMVTKDGIQRRFIRMEDFAAHPDTKWARAALASHLLNQHGVSVSPTAHAENKSIADLLEAHALAHSSSTPMIIPHIHVPEELL